MSNWIAMECPLVTSPVPGHVVVDVLYDGEAAYRRIRANEVEWGRRINPPVLWRVVSRPGAGV
ncbi:MAG: hypothetical protein KGL54_12385 [Sphingomonadales bacterium]|nr:hypothetical protein [Sphingomonadales bacterium]